MDSVRFIVLDVNPLGVVVNGDVDSTLVSLISDPREAFLLSVKFTDTVVFARVEFKPSLFVGNCEICLSPVTLPDVVVFVRV